VAHHEPRLTVPVEETDLERLRLERDLYRDLLDLGGRDDAGPFLEAALGILVRLLRADQGYLEVFDSNDGPSWSRAAGFSDDEVERVRSIISRGIIAEALAQGDVVVCPSALLDPRFKDRPSVQALKIEAVLCTPIIRQTPIGVLYLQSPRTAGRFTDTEVERARTIARYLGPLVEGLLIRSRCKQADHVEPFRKRLRIEGVVGGSAALAKALREMEAAAPLDVAVVITGETGTGKTQLARLLHENGPRRGRPFVELNCATFQDTLVERELFGAAAGAHSTATRRIEGKIDAAGGGTLFLDEVAELSPAAQCKLLKFLEEGVYYPLGSNVPLTADVRVIAATNDDLKAAVEEKRFRRDLYFRLKVLGIRMPSLAERREDVILLAQALSADFQRRNKWAVVPLSPGALRAIDACDWPGNVRELQSKVQEGAAHANLEHAVEVTAAHVFRDGGGPKDPGCGGGTFHDQMRRAQKSIIQKAVEASDWNVTQAARALDLTRAHLHSLIKAFGLQRGSRSSS
jgi:Nif-specific regulatory protein